MSYLILRADVPDEFFAPITFTRANGDQILTEFDQRFRRMGVLYGELSAEDPLTPLDPSLSRVSHVIDDVFWVGNELQATIRVLRTQRGNELQALLAADIVHFRPRLAGYRAGTTLNIKHFFTIDAHPGARDPFFIARLRGRKLARILQ